MEGELWQQGSSTIYPSNGALVLTFLICASTVWRCTSSSTYSTTHLHSTFFRETGASVLPTEPPLNKDFQIINLTDHILTVDETRLLKKGLGFVPTTRFDPFLWTKDIDLFIRKLKWKKFFKHNDRERCIQLGLSEEDLQGVDILHDLLSENERGLGSGPFTELHPVSKRAPPRWITQALRYSKR